MKKIIAGVLALLFVSAGCFAADYKTGERITYRFLSTSLDSETYIASVIPDGESGFSGFYIVEILTVLYPAGSKSAIGVNSVVTRYRLKKGDTISVKSWLSYDRKTLTVKAIGDNHIDLEEAK